MAKKNLFSAETVCYDSSDSLEIQKKAVLSYNSVLPQIEAHGKCKILSNKGFAIGRDRSNAVIVADPRVSKFHADFSFKRGRAFIRDTGSTNGTWINEKQIPTGRAVALKNGDVIYMGDTEIRFRS